MDEVPPSRYDYEILLDYDPSGTISRNFLGSFQNLLLLTNRSNLSFRTFWMTLLTLLTDAVNSALEAQSYQMQYLMHVNLTSISCYEALTTYKGLMVSPDIIR